MMTSLADADCQLGPQLELLAVAMLGFSLWPGLPNCMVVGSKNKQYPMEIVWLFMT